MVAAWLFPYDFVKRYHTGFSENRHKKRAKRQGALPFLKT